MHLYGVINCELQKEPKENEKHYFLSFNLSHPFESDNERLDVECQVGDVVVPDEISYIGTMFANSNITSIRIPSSVLEIEDGAFENCAQLKWVIIDDKGITQEDGVSTIGDDAFKNCSALKYIVLPACLKTIGANAFFGCSLDSVYYHDKSYAWSSITQTDSCLTGNVYYFSLKEQTLETYYSNIEWHYDNNGNPVTWLTVKNNLKGKTFTVTDAVATVSDFYWESIVAAKTQNALTPDLVDAKFYEAAMSSNTKEEFESALGQIYANQLGIAKFGTSGIVLVTNELGEAVSYTYVELNDRIFMKPYGHSNGLQGTFYVDQNGNVYEIQNAKKLLGYETITVKYIYTETPN